MPGEAFPTPPYPTPPHPPEHVPGQEFPGSDGISREMEQRLSELRREAGLPPRREMSMHMGVSAEPQYFNFGPQYELYEYLRFPLDGGDELEQLTRSMNVLAGEGYEHVSTLHYYELAGKKNYVVVIMGKVTSPKRVEYPEEEINS